MAGLVVVPSSSVFRPGPPVAAPAVMAFWIAVDASVCPVLSAWKSVTTLRKTLYEGL